MDENMTFEQKMEQLTALVEALESGEMSLEESFQAYEKGARLAAKLKAELDQGDRRIAALTESLKEIDISGEVSE